MKAERMIGWMNAPQRIVQTNLRLPDAALDPEALAEELKRRGITAFLFNVGGIFAWYPTELPLQARHPWLDRDLLGDMLKAAHARGLRLIGRYDLSKGRRPAYDAHPDWFSCGPDGVAFEYNGTYQACVNGGWYRHQGPLLLEETLGRYDIDGIFFNMFGYLAADYSFAAYPLCHCPNCRALFRDETGADLPARRDLSDPLYRRYLAFQDRTSRELQDEIRLIAKRIRPDIMLSNMGLNSDFFRGEVNRNLTRPSPEWMYSAGEQARHARSLGRNRARHSAALTHFVDFPWRYAAESGDMQVLRLAQQIANGADPHYYFMGPPAQADRRPLTKVWALFDYHRANEAAYAGLEPTARIGLFSSARSRRFAGNDAIAGYRGAYRALVELGIDFDLVAEALASLPEAEVDAELGRYDTLVLASCACLDRAEAEAIDRFAAAGGTVVAIGETAMRDEIGTPLTHPSLACLPFSTMAEVIETRGGYLSLDAGAADEAETDVLLLDGPYLRVEPRAGSERRHRLLLPQRFGPPELCYPDEGLQTDLPGILVAAHGKGRCVFLPWQADQIYMRLSLPTHSRIIVALAQEWTRPPAVELIGATRLEMTVQRQTGTGDLLVHLVNYSGQSDALCLAPNQIAGARLRLRTAGPVRATALVAGSPIEARPDGSGMQELPLPPIGAFEAVRISGLA